MFHLYIFCEFYQYQFLKRNRWLSLVIGSVLNIFYLYYFLFINRIPLYSRGVKLILSDHNKFWNNDLFDVLMISMYKKTIRSTNVC
jgi:hypothetical protein